MTADPLICHLCWYSTLLFFVFSPHPALSPHFLLLAWSSIFSMSALLHLFPHSSSMQDCKHKAHNCSLWPHDFPVIAITMLAGSLMSLFSSLRPRSLQIQIKRRQVKQTIDSFQPGRNLDFTFHYLHLIWPLNVCCCHVVESWCDRPCVCGCVSAIVKTNNKI